MKNSIFIFYNKCFFLDTISSLVIINCIDEILYSEKIFFSNQNSVKDDVSGYEFIDPSLHLQRVR